MEWLKTTSKSLSVHLDKAMKDTLAYSNVVKSMQAQKLQQEEKISVLEKELEIFKTHNY